MRQCTSPIINYSHGTGVQRIHGPLSLCVLSHQCNHSADYLYIKSNRGYEYM